MTQKPLVELQFIVMKQNEHLSMRLQVIAKKIR
jgi:hypothetical protein